MGKTRAKQHYINDNTRRRAMSVLLHGDAAFAGQARTPPLPLSRRSFTRASGIREPRRAALAREFGAVLRGAGAEEDHGNRPRMILAEDRAAAPASPGRGSRQPATDRDGGAAVALRESGRRPRRVDG